MNLQSFQKINCEFITELNINGLYWIQIEEIRYLIAKCVNLEHLLAIGTKLNLIKEDIEVINDSAKVSF